MFFSTRSVAALASLLFAAGCAAGTAETASSAASESDLSTQQAPGLMGAFVTESGPIKGLILGATGDSFVADIATDVQCVMAPCPTSEHVTGTFTSTATTITLESATASDLVAHHLGTYNYTLVDGVLALHRGEGLARDEKALDKKYSYCVMPADCQIQAIEAPRCVGAWTCETNTCAFACAGK